LMLVIGFELLLAFPQGLPSSLSRFHQNFPIIDIT